MKNSVIKFIRIRGRIIPVNKSLIGAPDEIQKITHIKKARSAIKEIDKTTSRFSKKFIGVFYKNSKKQSKEAGSSIAKRLAKLKKGNL